MKTAQNIHELYQIIEKYHKENPSHAILFLATDKQKIVHLVTDNSVEIASCINAVSTDLHEVFKEIAHENTL